jgi:hypothetical protein
MTNQRKNREENFNKKVLPLLLSLLDVCKEYRMSTFVNVYLGRFEERDHYRSAFEDFDGNCKQLEFQKILEKDSRFEPLGLEEARETQILFDPTWKEYE